MIVQKDGMVLLKQPRRVDYGLVQGSADLIGWRSLVITPDHVGKTIAQFLSLEVKTDTGKPTDAQTIWLQNVQRAGGAAGIVRSIDDVNEVLDT